eukprot:m.4519 g.4519  ORF g.4519 m.4519 type:complete len:611 (-) comp1914_c0_seq1:118-1950(-)
MASSARTLPNVDLVGDPQPPANPPPPPLQGGAHVRAGWGDELPDLDAFAAHAGAGSVYVVGDQHGGDGPAAAMADSPHAHVAAGLPRPFEDWAEGRPAGVDAAVQAEDAEEFVNALEACRDECRGAIAACEDACRDVIAACREECRGAIAACKVECSDAIATCENNCRTEIATAREQTRAFRNQLLLAGLSLLVIIAAVAMHLTSRGPAITVTGEGATALFSDLQREVAQIMSAQASLSHDFAGRTQADRSLASSLVQADASLAQSVSATASILNRADASLATVLAAISTDVSARAHILKDTEASLATVMTAIATDVSMLVSQVTGGLPKGAAETSPTSTKSKEIFHGTCQQILAERAGLPSGQYTLVLPGQQDAMMVYCDMTTLGGGWTLIAQSVSSTQVEFDAAGGHRNLYNLRDGGGNYSFGHRGASTWSLPNAAAIARESSTILLARWAEPAAATGEILTANAASYFPIPAPADVTFANPSHPLTRGSTDTTGPCVPVVVIDIKSPDGKCRTGCTRYTYKASLGNAGANMDGRPVTVGASVRDDCTISPNVAAGPAITTDDTGSHSTRNQGFQGKNSIESGAPHWHCGVWDSASRGHGGVGTVWLR